MTGPELEPSDLAKGVRYDPQGSGMDHDALFAELAPGVANSGNLAHKWYPEGDHTCLSAPPTGLKGD